jgi:hypothetical protein
VAQEHQKVTIQIALIYDWVIFEVPHARELQPRDVQKANMS